MAQTVKSVLFVDFDSIHSALQEKHRGAGDLLAAQAGAWLAAVESGQIVSPALEPGGKRRLLVKRCYADPKLLGKGRGALISNGVQIVDCPPIVNGPRHSTHSHLLLDALDALEHATGFDEFILLSADADLTPLLFRLRAHNRETVIYGSSATPASYKAFADSVFDEDSLLRVLRSNAPVEIYDAAEEDEREARPRAQPKQKPAPREKSVAPRANPKPAPVPVPTNERERLVSLARRISEATRVPLFSSKVYADLFNELVQEIADNGYRFQTTAENVSNRLAQLGRTVTRRQIGFVVKGLALKGHVFAAEDTAEALGGVFHQQVLYLARQSGLNLSAEEETRVGAWILGGFGAPGVSSPRAAEAPAPKRQIAAPPPPPIDEAEIDEDEDEDLPQVAPVVEKPAAAPVSRLAKARAAAAARAEAARAAFRTERKETSRSESADPEYTRPTLVSVRNTDEEPRRPSGLPRRRSGRSAEIEPAPSASEPMGEPDEMENSILAAIAQAVDVLVEQPAEPVEEVEPRPVPAQRPSAPTAARRQRSAAPPEPPKFLTEDNEGDGDDIGDEIQRILAGYKDNRG